jgi:transposase
MNAVFALSNPDRPVSDLLPEMNVIMAYDDRVAGLVTKQLLDGLIRDHGELFSFVSRLWRFSSMEESPLFDLAARDTSKAITQVAIDMSPACRKGVRKKLGNATIVYDKFHVVRQVSAGVEAVRRLEVRQDAAAREHLTRTCWLSRKNPERWTERERERYDQLTDKLLVTGLAYAMRLDLQRAYASASERVARSRLVKWYQWVQAEARELSSGLLAPMRKAAAMVERHLEGILGHWKEGLTTAFLEGLNSLFSATKRKARGYRSSEHQITMLYFDADKLEIPHYG